MLRSSKGANHRKENNFFLKKKIGLVGEKKAGNFDSLLLIKPPNPIPKIHKLKIYIRTQAKENLQSHR